MKSSIINLRYNEKRYAESLIEYGFHTKYTLYELKILAKYYKYAGFKPKERKELLYGFCEKYITGFNKVLYFKTINSALNHAKMKQNKLIIIEEIPITVNEMDYINKLELDDTHKKLLFTLLVKDKLNKEICLQLYGEASKYNSYGGKSRKYKELLEVSKIQTSNNKMDLDVMINHLSQNYGLLEVWSKGKVNMLFINEIKTCEEIATVLTSFDDIGYYYDFYNGLNKVVKCESCGILFRMRGNNHRMCNVCWKDKERNLWRENKRKKRNVQVLN